MTTATKKKTAKRTRKNPAPEKTSQVMISAPNMVELTFSLTSTAPYVSNRFTRKAFEKMRAGFEMTPEEKKLEKAKNKERPARDFDDDFEQAKRYSTEGWLGIPATAFRRAMVDACRMTDAKMTNAKMSVFIIADGFDRDDGIPLIRIHGKMERLERIGINKDGSTDIRVAPVWYKWKARLRVRFDADQFTKESVTNLLERAARQVGIGAGRPYSVNGSGCGWGTFTTGKS